MSLPRVSSIRAILKFPARMAGAEGITVTSSSGVVTSSLDILSLPTEATPAAGDYIITYNTSTGVPNKTLVSSLITSTITAFDPIVYTTNQTVTSAAAGRNIILEGSAMGTLTYSTPLGYPSTFTSNIFNQSSRRWSVVISGQPVQWLWPGQDMRIANDGAGTWAFKRPELWMGSPGLGQTGPFSVQLFVDPVNGVDTSDGLATGTGAFNKIQQAINIAEYNIGCNVTVVCSPGTHTPPTGSTDVIFRTGPMTGKTSGCIEILGDTSSSGTTRLTYILQAPAGGACVNVQDHSCLGITGFYCTTTGSGAVGVSARQLCICDLVDMAYGNFPSGVHISATNGASIGILASVPAGDAIVVTGGCAVHVLVSNSAYVNYGSENVNITTPITFTDWIAVTNGEVGGGPMSFHGAGAGAASVGQQYSVAYNGVYFGNGATLPGNTAGQTFTGGQAVP